MNFDAAKTLAVCLLPAALSFSAAAAHAQQCGPGDWDGDGHPDAVDACPLLDATGSDDGTGCPGAPGDERRGCYAYLTGAGLVHGDGATLPVADRFGGLVDGGLNIEPGATSFQRVARIDLVPAGVIDSGARVDARIDVQQTRRTADSDLFVGLSDGLDTLAGSRHDNDLFSFYHFVYADPADVKSSSRTWSDFGAASNPMPAVGEAFAFETRAMAGDGCGAVGANDGQLYDDHNFGATLDPAAGLQVELVGGDSHEAYRIDSVCVRLTVNDPDPVAVQAALGAAPGLTVRSMDEISIRAELDAADGFTVADMTVLDVVAGAEITDPAQKAAICGALEVPFGESVTVDFQRSLTCEVHQARPDALAWDGAGHISVDGVSREADVYARYTDVSDNGSWQTIGSNTYLSTAAGYLKLYTYGQAWVPGGELTPLSFPVDGGFLGELGQRKLHTYARGDVGGVDYVCHGTIDGLQYSVSPL